MKTTTDKYAGHTPGPWHAFPPISLVDSCGTVVVHGKGWEIHNKTVTVDADGAHVGDTPNRIAMIEYPYTVDQQAANARLIADAPLLLAQRDELAAALRGMLVQYGEYKDGDGEAKYHAVNIALAAMAKIGGGA